MNEPRPAGAVLENVIPGGDVANEQWWCAAVGVVTQQLSLHVRKSPRLSRTIAARESVCAIEAITTQTAAIARKDQMV